MLHLSRLLRSPASRRIAALLGVLACTGLVSSCHRDKNLEIHVAAKAGEMARVRSLLKQDRSLVSSKDEHGRTPLHLAAEEGHKDVAELLLTNNSLLGFFFFTRHPYCECASRF